jgi:hypothetical protein
LIERYEARKPAASSDSENLVDIQASGMELVSMESRGPVPMPPQSSGSNLPRSSFAAGKNQ